MTFCTLYSFHSMCISFPYADYLKSRSSPLLYALDEFKVGFSEPSNEIKEISRLQNIWGTFKGLKR